MDEGMVQDRDRVVAAHKAYAQSKQQIRAMGRDETRLKTVTWLEWRDTR